MSLSQTDFVDHTMWAQLTDATSLLNKTADLISDDALADVETLNHLREAFAVLESAKHIPPWRIPDGLSFLDQLGSDLTNIIAELNALGASPTASRGTSLSQWLDDMMPVIDKFPLYLVQEETSKELLRAQRAEKTFVLETVNWLHKEVEDAQEIVTKLKEFNTEQRNSAAAQTRRIDDAIANNSTTFVNRLEEWKADSVAANNNIAEIGRDHLNALKELEERSRTLLDSTSRRVISDDYGKYAQAQERAAFLWSLGAVLTGLFGFGYLGFLLATIHEASIQEVIIKATVSSLVVVTAGFMTRESSGHRKTARDAKRTQLDLNALDPFLTKLHEDDANVLRTEFARKIFGRALAGEKEGPGYSWSLAKKEKEKDDEAADDDEVI